MRRRVVRTIPAVVDGERLKACRSCGDGIETLRALDDQTVEEIAAALESAAHTRQPIAPLSQSHPGITTDDAYAIQHCICRSRLEAGRRIIGKKVGLTSKAMQEMLGVNEPDFGCLFDDMLTPEGKPLRMSAFIQPRLEGEIAFILERPLEGPGVTISRVLSATRGVTAAIEIIDSRIGDWKINIQDTIADNGSSGALVLGGQLTPVDGLDLRTLGMVFEKNGETAFTAAGAAVLGHPAGSVAWLANALANYGMRLEAGDIVMSGSLAGAVKVEAGDGLRVIIDRLGEVGLKIIA